MEAWEVRNAEWVKKLELKGRDRAVPDTGVVLGMEPGKVYTPEELPAIGIAPGVGATISWAKGTLLEVLEMEPDAQYPAQTMTGELITVVEEGSTTCELDGKTLELGPDAVLYLTEGMHRALRAGPDGLKALEVFSPVRADHLRLAGTPLPEDADVSFPDQEIERSSHEPGKVYNFNEIQVTPIIMPGKSPSEPTTARTRLIWGRNFMLSFVQMDPNSSFPMHIHPEDQLMMILGGAMEEGVIDEWLPMCGDQRHVILQPGSMAHAARLSPHGADVLDVFWPVRPDYMALYEQHAGRLE